LTFCASTISTCQPAISSWSCTKRAPFIDSIAAYTGSPNPPTRSASAANPPPSGIAVVTANGAPASSIR
jgi:hypothetical protein